MRAFTFEFEEFLNLNFEIFISSIKVVDSKLPEFLITIPYPASQIRTLTALLCCKTNAALIEKTRNKLL